MPRPHMLFLIIALLAISFACTNTRPFHRGFGLERAVDYISIVEMDLAPVEPDSVAVFAATPERDFIQLGTLIHRSQMLRDDLTYHAARFRTNAAFLGANAIILHEPKQVIVNEFDSPWEGWEYRATVIVFQKP